MSKINPFSDSYGLSYPEGDISLERIPYQHVKSELDKTHVVLEGETLLSIAHKYYGDSGFWGNIADVNSIYDITEEVTPGLSLLIPYGGK